MESGKSFFTASRVIGGIATAIAISFGALTIRFVSEIRSDLAKVEQKIIGAEEKITVLREQVIQQLRETTTNQTNIRQLEERIEAVRIDQRQKYPQ